MNELEKEKERERGRLREKFYRMIQYSIHTSQLKYQKVDISLSRS